jgi:hypothetical protein
LARARQPDHGGAAPRPWLSGDPAATVRQTVAERDPLSGEPADRTVDGRGATAAVVAVVADALSRQPQ